MLWLGIGARLRRSSPPHLCNILVSLTQTTTSSPQRRIATGEQSFLHQPPYYHRISYPSPRPLPTSIMPDQQAGRMHIYSLLLDDRPWAAGALRGSLCGRGVGYTRSSLQDQVSLHMQAQCIKRTATRKLRAKGRIVTRKGRKSRPQASQNNIVAHKERAVQPRTDSIHVTYETKKGDATRRCKRKSRCHDTKEKGRQVCCPDRVRVYSVSRASTADTTNPTKSSTTTSVPCSYLPYSSTAYRTPSRSPRPP